jgi:predicted O-methyltransferase YrrM
MTDPAAAPQARTPIEILEATVDFTDAESYRRFLRNEHAKSRTGGQSPAAAPARRPPMTAIDQNHANLVTSLVTCQKPLRILELGFGTGATTRAIIRGLAYNTLPVSFEVVDDWTDFGGKPSPETEKPDLKGVTFVTSTEEAFVKGCEQRYDFIFSDADHFRTQEWFGHVYDDLLNAGGILIYHDVTNTQLFPNLLQIYGEVNRKGYHHALFNKRSRPDEACERGLLVIFKP